MAASWSGCSPTTPTSAWEQPARRRSTSSSSSLEDDVAAALQKVEAGARFLITQLVFDNSVYFSFLARARAVGIDVPIIPGIMPITNVDQVTRFTAKIGASIPAALRTALADPG